MLLSVLLRPPIPPGLAFTVTMLAAVSVASAVERATGLACALKWPNDVLVGERKLAGILCEMSLARNTLEYVIAGIGLNVNADLRSIPEIAETATSIYVELGTQVDRLGLLCCLLSEIDTRYKMLIRASGQAPDRGVDLWQRMVFDEWRPRLVTLGKKVVVSGGGDVEEGEAVDVALDGALILRRPNGEIARINAGDVSVRLPVTRA